MSKRLRVIAIAVLILILGSLFFLWKVKGEYFTAAIKQKFFQDTAESRLNEEAYAMSHIEEALTAKSEDTVSENEIEAGEETLEATSEEETREPLTNEIVKIRDIYTEEDSEIVMKSFYPGATYLWEQYNLQTREWNPLESTVGMDELFRPVSLCSIQGEKSLSPIVLRCTSITEEQEYVDVASIHILDKAIKEISAADYSADAGSYIRARDIPVKVTYTDGSEEEIAGLYGLYWIQEEENIEYSHSISGNMVETVTTTLTNLEYLHVQMGKEEKKMCYRIADRRIDIPITVEGKDLSAPTILKVELGEYQISNIDEPVPIRVTVTAVDNHTMQTELSYCFLPEGAEPAEEDWHNQSAWEEMIDKNGIWIAYVKDASGNVSTSEREIIAVDQKAPTIKVSLENTDWCTETKIMVEATDNLDILYSFSCPETGESSGWITEAEYPVKQNGIWIIQAKDTLGNMGEKEFAVTNIDKQMPVIQGITVVTQNTQGEKE